MPSTLTTLDGATLHVRDWTPEGESWLRLLLIHGAAEHSLADL